jgi:hypothetical protein
MCACADRGLLCGLVGGSRGRDRRGRARGAEERRKRRKERVCVVAVVWLKKTGPRTRRHGGNAVWGVWDTDEPSYAARTVQRPACTD